MAIKISGSTIIDDSRNIVNAGIITASSFSGDGSGLTGVGIGTDDSINTTGIVTATKFSAQRFVGTGDKLIFSPSITSFSPTDGATGVSLSSNIVLTFDQPIYAGVGSIFLRNSSGIGTVIEAISINSSMINNQTLTINPSSDLPSSTDVYVVLPQGVVKNSVGGNIASVSTYNFTTLNFTLSSITPSNGATNVLETTNITLSFTSPPTRGTGTITLRSGSASGTILESFDAASSGRISVSGNNWILDPTSSLPYNTSIFLVIPNTAIQSYAGLNVAGASTHSFTTQSIPLGSSYEGGYLICKSSPTRWVVAPNTSEVSRTWYCRNDSNTRAQQVSGCTGWFVPTCAQLQNPGYSCRTYWDSYSSTRYWSSTASNPYNSYAWYVNFSSGGITFRNSTNTDCVRSFRCVTY